MGANTTAFVLQAARANPYDPMAAVGLPEQEPLPDAAHVELLSFAGHQMLRHKLTGEEIIMQDPAEGVWTLASDDQGRSYVCNGDTVEWSTNLFEHCLFRGPTESEPIIDCDGRDVDHAVPLRVWLHRQSGDRRLQLVAPVFGKVDFQVKLCALPARGACVWWNMLDLYSQVGFHGRGNAGRWAAAAWGRWSRYIAETCELPGHMLNKASACGGNVASDQVETRMFDDDRAADFRMCSTQALICLLTKWAFGARSQGGLGLEEDREAAKGLLSVLLAKLPNMPLPFFAGDVRLLESGWPQGSASVALPLAHGCVHLSALSSQRSPSCKAVCRLFPHSACKEARGVHIIELIARLMEQQKDKCLANVLKCLLWWLGKALDAHLKNELAKAPPGRFADEGSRVLDKRLNKYFLGVCEAFFQPKVLHLALDQGTIGKKPTVLGMMALPNNCGAIFPPQVRRRKFGGQFSAYGGAFLIS